MVALYTVWYNFCRIHQTLKVTPAMEAEITDRLWTVADIVAEWEAEQPRKKPGRKPKQINLRHYRGLRPIGRAFEGSWLEVARLKPSEASE
jgi:hypothetical protein